MDLRYNPELMVIGDSLAQGCRSLSVSQEFCWQSYGARISSTLGWPFVAPDHPRPVCFDAEALIRKSGLIVDLLSAFIIISKLKKTVKKNLKSWQKDLARGEPLSKHLCFDNIGIAGTKIPDLMQRSAASSIAEAESTLSDKDLDECSIADIASLAASLHIPFNAAFTLNPSMKKKYASWSPMDWVEQRRPKRLIVQTGHNHGLFNVGFSASRSLISYASLDGADELALRLAKLPEETGEIYWMLLPKVSAVANLIAKGSLNDGYGEEYRSAFNPSAAQPLAGTELAAIDRSIQDTNEAIMRRFREIFESVQPGNAKRLWFIDTYELLTKYDYKNTGIEEKIIHAGKQRINNRRLDGKSSYIGRPNMDTRKRKRGGKLIDGGFQSADGMHPSGVGYAVFASDIMHFMGMPHDRQQLLVKAFKEDRLLERYPLQLDSIFSIIDLLQKFDKDPQQEPSLKLQEKESMELNEFIGFMKQSLQIE